VNDDVANPVRGPLNRRTVLAAGGVATASAAVLAVAGCATYDSNSSPAPASTGAAGSTAAGAGTTGAASTPAEAAQAPAAQAPAAGAPAVGTAVGPTSSVPVCGGKIFEDQSVVVTQPSAGTFKAFSAICTHQGCTVSSVSGGTINCPCHGSKFKIADGSVASGPAKRPLPGKQVTASGGQLSIT
jgi:Rieske Fe-S protein